VIYCILAGVREFWGEKNYKKKKRKGGITDEDKQ